MSLESSWTRIKLVFAVAVVVGTTGAVTNFVGCGTTTTYATTDPYLYTVYYPADVAYSTVYWTDDWYYPSLYAIYGPTAPAPVTSGGAGSVVSTGGTGGVVATGGAGGSTVATGGNGGGGAGGTGGATTGGVLTTAGDAIRALARGESVCPGAITVAPKTAPPACTGGTSRAGVTIVFDGCQTPGGATLDGMVDVSSTRTASSPDCNAGTTITLSHTTTITNLSYTNAAGQRLIIPSQTGMGTTTYTFGQTPPTVALGFTGQLQTFASAGSNITSDHNYTGNLTFTFGGANTGYQVDGGVTVMDNRAAGSGSTVTVTGLKRVTTCCRPVGGTISLTQVGPTGPGSHVWSFGPACGESTIDGSGATLPACI
ncbi:MAG TPA: hypothetical protein VHL80_14265 [Polyangia bacterium]|nr:hypothetical protein [Polyangia bacterium]